MSHVSDIWYVRFPDGRVVRAPTTDTVREHIASGQIPSNSRVRRSPDDEWEALDWTEEFADLVNSSRAVAAAHDSVDGSQPFVFRSSGDATNLASRLDPARLQTVGLRGLAEELLAALDSALSRRKLLIAAVAAVAEGITLALAGNANTFLSWPISGWIWAGTGLLLLTFTVIAVVPLTRMTYIELSRLRRARWNEVRVRWFGAALNLFLTYVLAGGAAAALIILLRWLPSQFATLEPVDRFDDARDFGRAVVGILSLILEMLVWPIAGFTFLLAPIVVIEERNAFSAIWQWWQIIRHHAGRLFLYESAAVLVGVANLAFALPLALAFWGRMDLWEGVDTPFGFAVCVLAGLTAAPLLAYLAVAHVFIYLNLRYEVGNRRQ